MSSAAQNTKTGHNALGITENGSRRAKHENGTDAQVPPKMCPGAHNMKTGPDTIGTVENESRRAKYEFGTRRPRYRRK
jgi:hypothetical protein